MPVDVSTRITIARPREKVAAYACDPDRATTWYRNIASVAWWSSPPLAVGSQLEFSARFLGRTLNYTYEVVEWLPGERFVMRTAEGPFPMRTTYTFADDAGGTLMTLRNDGEPSGFTGVIAPVMSAAMRRANGKDLARLKRVLEDRSPPRGATALPSA